MISDPSKLLKNASRPALAISIEHHRAHRNVAIFFALVSIALIYWQDWNKWTFFLPAILIIYAGLRQSNIMLLNHELKSRQSEEESNASQEKTAANEGDRPIVEDNSDSTDWVAKRVQEIEQIIRNKPLSETEKKSFKEELSSLNYVLKTREANREKEVEKIRLEMEEHLKKTHFYSDEQEILPTFHKWLTFQGNSCLERTEALVAYTDYIQKRFDEENA